MPNKIKTGICIGDLHFPWHNTKFWESFLKVIDDNKPDYFLFGGDNLDMEAVNHHEIEKGNIRFFEGKRLRKDYDNFQSEILNSVEDALPKHCNKTFMYGNHEEWIEREIDKIPQLEGFAEIDKCLKLKDWNKIQYGDLEKIGKIYFHHGLYTGVHHTKKMVETYEHTIVSFHLHTYQIYTKITPINNEAHTSYSMPCACRMDLPYMKGRPNSWINGFGVFYVQENGNFNINPVVASKDHFVFNGKYY